MMESANTLDRIQLNSLEDREKCNWLGVSLPEKNTFIVVPAYNAEKKILSVFERIPREVWDRQVSVVIVNDGSTDGTLAKIEEIRSRWGERISIIDKPQNEGYARAQKDGFTAALNGGAEIVILLHSDCQYAPEMLPELLKPLEEGGADIVQGSRMVNKRDALRGGMPFYKFLANVALSSVENFVYRLDFAEYHSGYMLYSRKALETIPFLKLSDTFHFDGEMLFVGAKKGLRVKELAIPTQYDDEESHLKPIQYGFNVLGIMVKYLAGKYDF
jgi:glycosyltransferase involved in cell wall biosynthesis